MGVGLTKLDEKQLARVTNREFVAKEVRDTLFAGRTGWEEEALEATGLPIADCRRRGRSR